LTVNAKTNAEITFLLVIDNAYMCAAIAMGATHHFPTGS
jgi:hypothetical protein